MLVPPLESASLEFGRISQQMMICFQSLIEEEVDEKWKSVQSQALKECFCFSFDSTFDRITGLFATALASKEEILVSPATWECKIFF